MAGLGVVRKPGRAFIVSNDYDCAANFDKLKGTHKDAERMAQAFEHLGYDVISRRNLMYGELINFISEAASSPYARSHKRLVFIFSGHGMNGDKLFDEHGRPRGTTGGKLCSQEGRTIEIESILDQFKPDKHPALGRMARLFFIDACRGSEEDIGVTLPLRTRGMCERGGQFLIPDRVPKDGNILVAYSTLPNHKAYEKSDGGLWMKLLAEAVTTQNDDITVVLTEVSSRLKKQCQSYPAFQTPQCINQLTERINFLAESGQAGNSATTVVQPTFGGRSPPRLPPQTRAPVVHPPSPTMKTAVAKLHEYCQQNDVKPEYKYHQVTGGFCCTVTVRGKQYNGETKSKKQDAKHSAAEVALQKLNSSSLAIRGGSSVSAVKELKEKYFDKNKIVFKKEDCFKTNSVNGGYQCTLCIDGRVFISSKCQSKSDAENGAARQALKHLKL